MRPLTVLNRPVRCHRFLTVFCAVEVLVSTFGAVALLLRWSAHLDLHMKLMLLNLFVFGLVWFLKAPRWQQRSQSGQYSSIISGDGE